MKTQSLINKLQEFLNDHDIKVDQELLSTSLKELNFSKTLGLLDMMKDRDMSGVAELLNINYDDAPVDEAYGTVGTQQPSASAIKAQTTKDNNNQRDFTNAQQDQQRAATGIQRTVAGGNKQATGQGAARSVGVDPDDVQRGQNAAQSNANAQLSNQNAAEIERLKALAYGRR